MEQAHSTLITKAKDAGFVIECTRPYRYKVTDLVAGLPGFECDYFTNAGLAIFDKNELNYPPDFICDFDCKLADVLPLITWKRTSFDLVHTLRAMKQLYIEYQKKRINLLENERLIHEMGSLPLDTIVNIQASNDGAMVNLECPLDKYKQQECKIILNLVCIVFKIKILTGSVGFDQVNVEYLWPANSNLTNVPKFKLKEPLIDHLMDVKLKWNRANRNELSGIVAREEFLAPLLEKFKKYLVEYDSEEYFYLSLLIIISTPSNNLQSSTDVLGASVVNGIIKLKIVHLSNRYPSVPPTIMLSSPLYFQDRDSCIPASRPLSYPLNPHLTPKQFGEAIR
jgi:hypothetical protein